MHRTIINFVQPQPNSIQNKNNPIGCGTAPGNLVETIVLFSLNYLHLMLVYPGKIISNYMCSHSQKDSRFYPFQGNLPK